MMIATVRRAVSRLPGLLRASGLAVLIGGLAPAGPASGQASGPAVGSAGVVATAVSPGDSSAVDAVFTRWSSRSTPGCAAGVSRGGSIVLNRAFGMADLEHDIPNTPETIFEAGSVSKQFTAAAVVLLELDGLLSLDDDVRRYIPELPDYGAPITIRHLLNHTSGLRDWGSVAELGGWGRGRRSHTHDHVLDILARQRALNHAPGDAYSYTNSGYNLAAILVERVAGEPFAAFSRRRIFEPLGLRDTQWRDDYRRIVKRRASAYSRTDGGYVIDRPIEDVHGNGGLLTTVADLLAWNEALAAGRLGGVAFVEAMHRQGVLNDGSTIAYAAGISIGGHRGVPEVSHTGATAGYRAVLLHYPDRQLGVAVLCNAGDVNPGSVGRAVADVFLGEDARPAADRTASPEPRQVPPEAPRYTALELAAYTGEYYSSEAEALLIVRAAGDGLEVVRRAGERWRLRPVEPDVFESAEGTVAFLRDPSGAVVRLSVRQARVWDLRFDRVTTAADVTSAPVHSSHSSGRGAS